MKYYYPQERVAVVALGCILPDAMNKETLWKNILEKRISIKEIPDYYFNKSVFYRPEAKGKINKEDKTYTKIAAVIDEFNFLDLGRKYRIPPAVSAYMDNNQKTAIYCVDQAIETMKSSLPKDRTAVILCNGAPGDKFENLVRRTFFANVESHILNHPEVSKEKLTEIQQVLKDVSDDILKNTQPVIEDTAPGYLQNIIAGRISNILDLWGPSYVIDAACASSLTAIAAGVSGLLNNEYDAVVTGGVEVTLSEIGLVSFSGINALSPDGSYPFDSRANGFVMGLGGGAIVLKRLSDALRDGDHIYSIISGYGQGSDGKGKYIAAPSEEGQIRVIKSACKMADYSVDTIEMIEAHGTGTIVGDVVETSALKKAFAGLGAQKENNCGLGSIKSNIGHLKNAAGIAGLIKATLALENKILPASANIVEINPKLQLEGSPFYVLQDNKKWIENSQHPRRANISAYGFGGADYHICLEEFRPEFLQKSYSFNNINKYKNNENNTADKEEAILFSGDSIEAVIDEYKSFIEKCEESEDYFEKTVYLNNISASCKHGWRISICASSLYQLKDKWKLVEQYIREDRLNEANLLNLKGIYVGNGPEVPSSQIAVMFPGQGSQYPNMLRGLYETYPGVKAFYMKADAIWESKYNSPITSLVFGNDDEQLKDKLKNTKNTHPAMFISNMGVYKLLCEAGIKADYMIGHSLGEITSLFAGEMIDLKSTVNIIGERGYSFDRIDENKRGRMLSIKEKADKVGEIIKSSGFGVSIANINSMDQTVVGGESKEIEKFSEYLNQNGYKTTLLNVSHAFHTSMVSKAADSFYESIKEIKFNNPKFKMVACHLTELYNDLSTGTDDMAAVLKEQILSPVRFAESILMLYDKGVRVFIESGPSNVLTNLVKNILSDKDVKVININNKSKCPVEGFKQALAMLFAHGVELNYVPSNNVLGLHEENVSTVVYKVEAQAAEIPHMDKIKVPSKNESQGLISTNVDSTISDITDTLHKNYGYIGINPGESLVYSGVSMGLPGTFKKAFTDDNFQYIVDGKNMIELLTDEEAESILDLNITRLIKSEKDSVLKKITTINEVIHLLGKMGKMDMINDYLIDEKVLNEMTQSVCAGVAAGYEALKDAGIPLVREFRKTASGSMLPGRLVLPEELQDGTGIIFASAHSQVESVISEVSKYTAAKFGSSARKDILMFFEAVISKVSDYESKKILSDWFALHYSRLSNNPSEADVYEFNHNFLALLSSQANNRLAQFIGATGPNMYISAACSSTASAVTVAEDLIRAGHAKRMIIIGADISSGKNMLPWFAAAFSSIGALTDSDSLYDAAVPFDNRRNGMILGSGAVGLVIEKDSDVAKRGMNGICRILGTHLFNAAGHQTRIDVKRHCIELDKFISKMESEYNLNRNALASKMVYCSHETYSRRQSGCSNMEKVALENTFGDKFKEIKVINTKGMTGHTLGASIEEAVSAKVLQYQKLPPIVNYKEPDPDLEGLNLSKGGNYEVEYVLRTVSAFGGNGNYHLLQRIANGDERIVNSKAYREWIERISSKDAELKNNGRLIIAEVQSGNELVDKGKVDLAEENIVDATDKVKSAAANKPTADKATPNKATANATPARENPEKIKDEVLEIYAYITKYPKEMLEPSMELEADLGIDTVKQATIFSILSEKFKLVLSEGQALSNYPTIGHIIELVLEKACNNNGNLKSQFASNEEELPSRKLKVEPAMKELAFEDCEAEVLKLVSEITLYPVELLDKEMEMEADLGIDTVKQATIFSILRERFEIVGESSENLSIYNTIGALIEFVRGNSKKSEGKGKISTKPLREIKGVQDTKIIRGNNDNNVKQEIKDGNNIAIEILNLISEITQYPVDMLEDDMELEADLGIDTIKQATIFSELSQKFNLDAKVKLNTSELNNIRSLINMVKSNVLSIDSPISLQSGKSQNDADNSNSSDITKEEAKEFTADDNHELELCVQYPMVVSENIGNKDYDLKDKNIMVIGDNSKTVGLISEHFKKVSSGVSGFVFEKCINSEELEEKIGNYKDAIKSTDVIIDCGHLGEVYEFKKLTYETEKEILHLNSLTRFIFYKKFSQIRPDTALRILCTVFVDGCFGFVSDENSKGDPYYGALSGFYKGLRKELGKSKVKIVDLGGESGLILNDGVLDRIHNELEECSSLYEVGYIDNKRVTLKLDNVERSEMMPVEKFDSNHFVITGGGNGITAGIALGISKHIKAKLTILGRTALPSNIEELSNLDQNALEQKKHEIYDQLKREGKKATPTEVQKEHNKLIKALSVYNLINDIKKNGCQVRYFSCDIREHESLKAVLNGAIADFGPVNVVVHGAGVEKSRLLGQKTKEEFEEVFEVKANGLCNLYRLIDKKHLKVLIAFSSISGRFGNEAQLDYCSANNFLSSFMSMVKSQNKKIRAVSISWSGWKDLGMAWRNEFVKENAEEMGLHLIEPERGVNEFINILTSNINLDEIVISKGLSFFVGLKKWHGIKNAVSLIDWVSKKEGEIKRIYKVLSVKSDPIINHHRVGKTPLMPAVGFMEMCAQAHSLIFEKKDQYCFKNLVFNNALKLFNEKPQEVIMKPEKSSNGFMKATFYNYFKPKIGEGKLVELNSMNVSPMIGDYEYLNELKEIETDNMEEILLKNSLEQLSKTLPNSINLGPLFMDEKASKINMFKYNDQGVVLSIALSEEQINNKKYNLDNLLINPAFADSLMQCCGIHSSVDTDGLYLPWQVEEFGIVNTPKESGLYKAYAKRISGNDSEKSYDVILYNDKGEVCYYAKRVTVKRIAQ
ncbi:type I polyketide synthase [Pseudobacteroides cellulosolvens]|uniref:6-deoxyerythronolide-B synthase n=1 Tax=Pseudobacteroides cellulosolvens ATCC 35603 = DSM 2933 TaxID=398512 RepID=A0A0L6JLI0_9FIRM|nr:type I polyketide synthase [Pseudobacteroides cellulosolvens]KNY26217.1 6-deoxyerythronolide-B synthase [Pseudobacteroides cellulosolvens ATCC 35603 = DSM 2933]